jgi:hypothetical protein
LASKAKPRSASVSNLPTTGLNSIRTLMLFLRSVLAVIASGTGAARRRSATASHPSGQASAAALHSVMLDRALTGALMIAALALPAAADPLRAPAPTKPAATKPAATQPLRQTQAANPCAAFGPGFVRAAGSDTCVKLGGGIELGAGGNSR